jgi:hypothetical protein
MIFMMAGGRGKSKQQKSNMVVKFINFGTRMSLKNIV